MTMEEFRRNRATASTSKTDGKNSASVDKWSTSHVNKAMNYHRNSNVSAKTTTKEEGKPYSMSVGERCERAKLLREKQIEERKKKHEERKAAVEDRRRQKEREESLKNDTLRQLLEHKTITGSRGLGSGRKLPSLPGDSHPKRETHGTRRLSSGSSSSDSASHTPPRSSAGGKTTRRNLTGPTSASTSCLSNFGNGRMPDKGRSNLVMSKKTSSSTNNLADKSLVNHKPTGKAKEKSVGSKSTELSGLPKSQSTGAIHQLGHGTSKHHAAKPPSGKKPKSKSSTTHHAGTTNEQEAKLALAEHRRKVREEAERQALLDKEKQEELRIQREEEERRLAEENARESARQQELAKILQEQEKERARLLREQQEREEAERAEAEARRKQEMEMTRKLELERRAREAEKREKEEEERLKREEEERQERRKKVEMIMSRTRMTASANSNSTKSFSSLEDLSSKLSDDSKYHSLTVTEILQKVKARSRASSPNPEEDAEKLKENEISERKFSDSENDKMVNVIGPIGDTDSLDTSNSENSRTESGNTPENIASSRQNRVVERGFAAPTTSGGEVDDRETDSVDGIQRGVASAEFRTQDLELWKNVEHFMQCSESRARDTLEKNGASAEDEDDEDCEEGQLWKVVEGKREISELI